MPEYDPNNPPDPPVPTNIIDKEILVGEYLWGMPTENFSTTCDKIPDRVYQRAIDAAYEWIETELTATVIPKNFLDEPHDFKREEYMHWAHFNLYHFPVLDVLQARAVFPTNQPGDSVKFPPEWHRVYKLSGILNLIPTAGTMAKFIIGRSGAYLPLVFSGAWDSMPQLFRVDYQAGMNPIPANINEVIGKKAAIEILAIISDILYPPGTTSISLGIDGVSQNIALTRSQLLFQARINEYKENIKTEMVQLRQRWAGIRFSVA